MKPEIIQLPALSLMGPHAHFISAMSPDANNLQVIPPLYMELCTRKGEMPPALDDISYGACRFLPKSARTRDDELEYMAGYNVAAGSKPPAGMGLWPIAAGTYAKFTHRGPISRLSETIKHAHSSWMPQSEYDYDGGLELERYGERFGEGDDENSEMDFMVRVKRKRSV